MTNMLMVITGIPTAIAIISNAIFTAKRLMLLKK